MNLSRDHRSLIAWMLYFSVLLSALHCGIGHGQMAGFALAGVGGAFCSAEGHAGPTLDGDSGDSVDVPDLANCLFCNFAVLVDLALLVALGTWLRPSRHWRRGPSRHGRTPPRQHWPPANPRAP
ncbi:hypothetical protein AvCA_22820 [Azotobacter vinelandii CA]|uniref:DUF2946 domain-containing protein n=2 Tax=Azotobacter vinelandii TaxID=354 RepID=C1DGG2_AZOVD|nr:DUF2946 domain-containing protein [Azotobacter vinelandii]ACO78473.1 hypothetical protein Avin_22820 [Azotobacter vinelandii DJ]AGK14994.1 hypothetical protein AvCA_22820 [Azotobacter vinelandii CA]AGK20536.1 hypothetical protein AvCA6_22820 [Azotobacter vinelandii CA6]WKN24171.1 DUF2946 domain-containing protein [Azotobacter vinelandii]SFX60898.1 Protein of unknown function [Azotobacter vinelandii]